MAKRCTVFVDFPGDLSSQCRLPRGHDGSHHFPPPQGDFAAPPDWFDEPAATESTATCDKRQSGAR